MTLSGFALRIARLFGYETDKEVLDEYRVLRRSEELGIIGEEYLDRMHKLERILKARGLWEYVDK